MELVETLEISGEEREIADAVAREQIAMNTENALYKSGGTVTQLPSINPIMIVSDLDYSTEEQLTGRRWIDGKPIYQKTYVINAPVRGSWTVFDERTTFDNLIDDSFRIIDNNGTSEQIYRGMTSDGNSTRVSVSKNGSVGKGLSYYIGTGIWSNQAVTTLTAVIIVQYTKTTDTASSPVAPPKVEAMHVYSTEEKVVGTWIDGRKIYEKTWKIDNTTATSNWDVTNADFENISFVVSATLYDTDSDSPRCVPVKTRKLSSTSIRFYTSDSWASIDAYTIQYVKTTDTATN